MSSFDTSRDKIQKVLDAGYRAHIMVVHPKVEDALDKTLQRFYEEGRGSSIGTIARIVGGLPDSLSQLSAYFGNNLLLDIIDVRDRSNPVNLQGFENVNVLRSEGNYEHIQQRLQTRIEQQRDAGRIDDAAYRQAAGLPPRDSLAVDSQRHERSQGDARERGSSTGRSGQAVLTADGDEPTGAKATAGTHLRVTKASDLDPNIVVRGEVIRVTDKHVLVQTGRTDAVEFARSDVSGAVRVGQRVQMNYQEVDQKKSVEQSQEMTPGKQEQSRGINEP